MNILIDTHIFLWLIYDTKKVNKKYMDYLKDLDNTIYLSAMSIAEIMIKKSIGNLEVDFDMDEVLHVMGIKVLDFDAKSAMLLGTLPLHHRDPFDRMIIAQAMTNRCKIISVDSKFAFYECELL